MDYKRTKKLLITDMEQELNSDVMSHVIRAWLGGK
jgi:hypothetical protein